MQRDAGARLKRYGRNALDTKRSATALGLLLNQFKSPLVLILIVATIISLVAAEWIDAGVVLAIVLGSAIFGFVALPAPLMLGMVGLTLAYVFAVELAKKWFYARTATAGGSL